MQTPNNQPVDFMGCKIFFYIFAVAFGIIWVLLSATCNNSEQSSSKQVNGRVDVFSYFSFVPPKDYFETLGKDQIDYKKYSSKNVSLLAFDNFYTFDGDIKGFVEPYINSLDYSDYIYKERLSPINTMLGHVIERLTFSESKEPEYIMVQYIFSVGKNEFYVLPAFYNKKKFSKLQKVVEESIKTIQIHEQNNWGIWSRSNRNTVRFIRANASMLTGYNRTTNQAFVTELEYHVSQNIFLIRLMEIHGVFTHSNLNIGKGNITFVVQPDGQSDVSLTGYTGDGHNIMVDKDSANKLVNALSAGGNMKISIRGRSRTYVIDTFNANGFDRAVRNF